MKKKLICIGVVHRDPAGEVPLQQLLTKLAPGLITLEMSPHALTYRQRQGALLSLRLQRILDRLARHRGCDRQELARRSCVQDIQRLLELPFEYRVASRHANEQGLPLQLIDQSEVSLNKLRRVEQELISYRNLKILLDLPERGLLLQEESYTQAARLLDDRAPAQLRRDFLAARRGEEGIGPRDAWMAQQLADALEELPSGGRLVHIGGWVHLLTDELGETLFSRLQPFRPQRLLLR